MFLLDVNDEEYGLKPMNCPGHATIFNENNWSYRDLPVRYAENGRSTARSNVVSSQGSRVSGRSPSTTATSSSVPSRSKARSTTSWR